MDAGLGYTYNNSSWLTSWIILLGVKMFLLAIDEDDAFIWLRFICGVFHSSIHLYWVLHFRNNNFVITWNTENHNHQNVHKQPRNCYQNEVYCIWSLSCDRCGGFVTLLSVCSPSAGAVLAYVRRSARQSSWWGNGVSGWSCLVFSSEYLHEQRLKGITSALDDNEDDQRVVLFYNLKGINKILIKSLMT